jgi:hypothetical protein
MRDAIFGSCLCFSRSLRRSQQIVLSLRYGEYRYRKSFFLAVTSSVWLEGVYWVLAGSCGWFHTSVFGQNNLPGIPCFGPDIRDGCCRNIRRDHAVTIQGRCGFTAVTHMGRLLAESKVLNRLWHLLLQILVPYILIHNACNYVVWLIAALLIIIFMFVGGGYSATTCGPLAASWLVFGALMLGLPLVRVTRLMGEYEPFFHDYTEAGVA